MSIPQPTPAPAAIPAAIPADFDAWRQQEGALATTERYCTGCHRTDLRCWKVRGANVLCEACLRRDHAFCGGQAEDLAAILAHFLWSAGDGFVRAVVEQALAQYERELEQTYGQAR